LDEVLVLYREYLVLDTVRVPPDKFGSDLKEVVTELLRKTYEGKWDRDLGVVLAVTEVEEIGVGKIIPGDGATYHEVKFKLISFKPELQEVVEGEVVDVAEFGIFVRIGPMDALAHVSQIMEDYISYDRKQGVLIGKESRRSIKSGDRVRARIIAVSMKGKPKIGLTMKQPGLGKIEWIEEEVKKKEKAKANKG